MNIDELLNRPSPQVYTIEECQFVVQKYIEKAKGKKVTVNIYKNFGNPLDLNPFGNFMLQTEIRNLWNAFLIASNKYYDI